MICFDREFDSRDRERQKQRRLIHALDKYGLKRAKKHYVIGQTVVERLRAQIHTTTIYTLRCCILHPFTSFIGKQRGRIYIHARRLHRWKRWIWP